MVEVYVRKPVESRLFRLGRQYFLLLQAEGREHYVMFQHGKQPSAHIVDERGNMRPANARLLENGTLQIQHEGLVVHLPPEELRSAEKIPNEFEENPWEYIRGRAGNSFTKARDISFVRLLRDMYKLVRELSEQV